MQKLVFILGKDGSIKEEAHGFKGPECIEKAEFAKKVFGKPKTELKPSYYEESTDLDQDLETSWECGLPSGYCG